jgi:hypothetical protein
MKKIFGIQALLWLALVLALVGSLRHVAWGFSTLESGDLVAGYVQAVAVDLGLFALAIGIQQRRRQRRGTGVLWIGVLLFAGLSTYANLLHGVMFKSDIDLSRWTSNVTIMSWLDFLRPVLLSGVLPLLVVYLSEIAGSDASYQLDLDAKQRKRHAKSEGLDMFPYPVEQAQALATEHARRSKAQALDTMLTLYADNPNATMTEIGAAIGRSRSTVSTYLTELEQGGRVRRNGDGVQVVVAEHI